MNSLARTPLLLAFVCGFGLTGCAELLGLNDKDFSGDGGGGTTGSTTQSGGMGGSSTSSTGTTLSGGTTSSGGSGGTGAVGGAQPCGAPVDITRLQDEFNFAPCGDATPSLESRGWHFARKEETYPPTAAYAGTQLTGMELEISLEDTLYWSFGEKGQLMYKELSGDFLVVTEVNVTDHPKLGLPGDLQSGAGIMVRAPFSSLSQVGNQLWAALDLGQNSLPDTPPYGPQLHISWQNPVNNADCKSDRISISAPQGKIAVCRQAGALSFWYFENGSWVEKTGTTYGDFDEASLPTLAQVGLFAYSANGGGVLVSPKGVVGAFKYVHQYDLTNGCDPYDYGE
ncbi:MAG: hypothetical protein IPK82_01545 [Polyangiaceae bacterium]|nr:hypothetical protein [Polyangiaceae bacterium]